MTLRPGQYVRHAKYGNGVIVERDDERTTVDFDTAGLKKFVTSIAAFEIAEGEAPKRKRNVGRRKAKPLAEKSPESEAEHEEEESVEAMEAEEAE